jgi:FAD-linked oxidoreductase
MNFDKFNLQRRQVLKGLGAAGAVGLAGVSSGCSKKPSFDPSLHSTTLKGVTNDKGEHILPWANWSGNQSCEPSARSVPRDLDELVKEIKSAKQGIRLVGSGHSFAPLVPTDETLMSLAMFYGISNIDKQNKQFDVGANTVLAYVGEELWNNGLSLINMPDINTQTFGGSIATSTHGTGINYGSLSTQVAELTLVNGEGEVLTCSADKDKDLFDAARCNLGALGAVTSFKMNAQERYHLRERSWMMKLDEGLAQLETLRDKISHFEAYALPHADYILGIDIERIDESELQNQKVSNGDAYETFRTISNLVDKVPFLKRFIINTAASTVEEEITTGRNYEIFGNLRDIRFNEMEYSVPAEYGVECLREVLTAIKKADSDVIFPIEYRYVKGDDIWLSPFYERDSCSISCHNFHDKDYKKYFALLEPIFRKYQGKPHWGKIHTLSTQEQAANYPKFNEFLKIRKQMDPRGLFANQHLKQVLGLS